MKHKAICRLSSIRSIAYPVFSVIVCLSLLFASVSPVIAAFPQKARANTLLLDVDLAGQVIALADQPLQSTPLHLRETAYSTLVGYTGLDSDDPYFQPLIAADGTPLEPDVIDPNTDSLLLDAIAAYNSDLVSRGDSADESVLPAPLDTTFGDLLYTTELGNQHGKDAQQTATDLYQSTPAGEPDPIELWIPTLALSLVNRIDADNQTYFFDEGRITSPLVMTHDWDLIIHLTSLIKDRSTDPVAKVAYLDGLLLLLKSDRHMAELALSDAQTLVSHLAATDGLVISDINKANALLSTAQIQFENAFAALRAGDPERASHHFYLAWLFGKSVLSIWNFTYAGDHDQDGLVDIIELRLGSNPFSTDTDLDGLPDMYEGNYLSAFTSPALADSDGNGVQDGEEDLDSDWLTNLEEFSLGTDPLMEDTDGDMLLDGFEAGGFSDPLFADTDQDGLRDDSEQRLGTDPRNPDSDGDGILDGDAIYPQILSNPDLGVSVDIMGTGDQSLDYEIEVIEGVSGFDDAPGLIGNFVDIHTTSPIVSARVTLSYDPTLAGWRF